MTDTKRTNEAYEAREAARNEVDRLRSLVASAIKNIKRMPDVYVDGEPGVYNGCLWHRVSELFGVGATSAGKLCEEFGEEPHWHYRMNGPIHDTN